MSINLTLSLDVSGNEDEQQIVTGGQKKEREMYLREALTVLERTALHMEH